jgi:hypothetical protein
MHNTPIEVRQLRLNDFVGLRANLTEVRRVRQYLPPGEAKTRSGPAHEKMLQLTVYIKRVRWKSLRRVTNPLVRLRQLGASSIFGRNRHM